MIGIIGAMSVEVDDLKACMSEVTIQTISGIEFYEGRIHGVECVVARCGVGKVYAAICAQTMILQFHPSVVINTGVAGGIGKDIHIGDVVISSGLVQHDMDTSAVGDEIGLISGINLVTIPAVTELVNLVSEVAQSVYDGKVHVGIIATGDQFICDAKKLKEIAESFHAFACEMEGGSIAQVCYVNQVDFIVIRAISDNADDGASVDFMQFAKEAAQKSAKLIDELLPKL
jgi:adenosylhomocysteine nucleosidase